MQGWQITIGEHQWHRVAQMEDFPWMIFTLSERVSMMRTNYQQLLTDRDYLLGIGELYHRALRGKELEVDRLTQELESTQGFLRGT